ncbi:unnamed protein product, partial [Prorocentrum cordatum]
PFWLMPFRRPPAPGPCPQPYPATPDSRGSAAGGGDLGERGFGLMGTMAAGGCGFSHPHGAAEGRCARRARARESADRLVRRLSQQLGDLKQQHDVLWDSLELFFGDAELAQRVFAVIPALEALIAGRWPERVDALRRNVALHAEAAEINVLTATPQQLRKAQRRRRLGPQAEQPQQVLRADAVPFSPSTGSWEQLPHFPMTIERGEGYRCTCGTVAFSSVAIGARAVRRLPQGDVGFCSGPSAPAAVGAPDAAVEASGADPKGA